MKWRTTLGIILVAIACLQREGSAMIYGPQDGATWDPSVLWHNGKYHAFLMYNKDGRDGLAAGHCLLATSTDGGKTFEKHAGDPIIEPGPKRYYAMSEPPPPFGHHAHPHIDCRDLAVVEDPSCNGWLGCAVMRRKGQQDAFHSACTALCRSKDLVRWEVGDPVCTPNRFNCLEVPDVFKLGDKWYMIALTGDASPLVNPAFVLQGWNGGDVKVMVEGRQAPRGENRRFGQMATPDGTNLVLWLRLESSKTVTLQVEPVGR